MNTHLKPVIAFIVMIAVVGPALAQKNFNSAKSNTSTAISKTGAKTKYSYSFNWTVDSGRKVLSKSELNTLLDQVFEEIRADILGGAGE